MFIRRLALIASALAVLGIGWRFWPADRPRDIQTPTAPSVNPIASTAQSPRPVSQAAAPDVKGRPLSDHERRWAERERAWCATGRSLAVRATGSAQELARAVDEHAEQSSEAYEELRLEWERRLRARPEPLSQASADLLWLMRSPGDAPEAALARLRDLAERTGDPALTGLAAQAHCSREAPECAGLLTLWLELEPGHLSALALMLREPNPTPAALQSQLERLLQARGRLDPRAAFLRQLETVEPSWSPGLRRQALMGVTGFYDALYANPSWAAVLRHCRTARPECEPVAEHLWPQARSLMEQVYVIAMVRARRPHSEVWQARARELEALHQWISDQSDGMLVNGLDEEMRCVSRSIAFDWVRGAALVGSATTIRAAAPKDPETLRSLSERFRSVQKRSMLDLQK